MGGNLNLNLVQIMTSKSSKVVAFTGFTIIIDFEGEILMKLERFVFRVWIRFRKM